MAPISNQPTSFISYLIVFLGVGAAICLAGADQEGGEGIFLGLLGVAMILCRAQRPLEMRFWWCGVGLAICLGLSLLPLQGLVSQAWRSKFVGLPVELGNLITPVPRETVFWLSIGVISIVWFLFLLSQPLRTKSLLNLTIGGAVFCACYAGLAIYSYKTGWVFPGDTEPTFGFFPNRNNAANFLISGCMLSLGLLGAAKLKHWGAGVVGVLSLGTCGTALVVYCSSRGGIVFLIFGTLLWVLGLGRKHWSAPLLISFASLFLAGFLFFLVFKGEARNRLFNLSKEVARTSSAEAGDAKDDTLDARIPIFKDTWKMICDTPLTGAGLGTYRYIYLQYRHFSLSESTSLHPESDWLMLAAEAGLPSVAIALVGGVFLFRRVASEKEHPYWPLRWGVLCAFIAGLAYAFVDLPIHRPALGWWLFTLAAMGLQVFPAKSSPAFVSQTVLFKVVGVAAVLIGGWMIRAQWFGGASVPPYSAKKLQDEILGMYNRGEEERANDLSSVVVQRLPMEQSVYYQKALLELKFEGTDTSVDQYFKAQRTINPDWAKVSILQGFAWITLDQKRTISLWKDALQRSKRMEAAPLGRPQMASATLEDLLRQSEKYPLVQNGLYPEVESDVALTLTWLRGVSGEVAKEKLGQIAANNALLAKFNPSEQRLFLMLWYEKGDRGALKEFARLHPDWEEAYWPVEIRQMVDAKAFQEAIKRVVERYQVDLSLPPSGGVRNLQTPEDSDDPLANFDYYWKTGNEITARRLVEEARLKTEKTNKPFPEIWKKSAALAMRSEQWEVAWRYLRQYLHESKIDSSL